MKNTKEKILYIAFETFLNHGFQSTTMNDLVKVANLSKGAFYHYYSNKTELYNAVIDRYFLSYFKQVDWEKFDTLSFSETDNYMRYFYIKFVNEINVLSKGGLANYYVMFFEACKYHPSFLSEVQSFYKQLESKVDVAIKKGGLELSAINVIAKYEGVLFWLSIFPKEKIETIINSDYTPETRVKGE